MFDDYSHSSWRSAPSIWARLRRRHWGEPTVFAFILLGGLLFSVIQFWTWVVPQLTLYQEFISAVGTVVEIKITEKQTSSGMQYRPEVLVEYSVKDQTFRVWTFDWATLRSDAGYSRDYAIAEKALDPFRPPQLESDRKIECWYRPDQPGQVIVHWNVSIWGWFFLFLSVSLSVLGLVGFLQSFRLKAVSVERLVAATPGSPFGLRSFADSMKKTDWQTLPDIRSVNESPGTHLAFRLPLANQPLFPLIGLVMFCLAWNVVSWSVFLHSVIYSGDDVSGQIAGTLLRALFFGVGIILMVWTIHKILLAFGTGPTLLEISDHPVYPGRRYRVLLHHSGVLRFRELTVDVVCEEIARFRQGTETITNRKDVFQQTLFHREDFETTVDAPLHQEFFLRLPIGAMHSFRQNNNEITWKLSVSARISGWPDIRRECPIIVRPSIWSGQTQEGIGL